MSLAIHAPKIRCHKETDGTWTATLYIRSVWHGQVTGCATPAEARAAIRRKYRL